jgi:hypothetical protein
MRATAGKPEEPMTRWKSPKPAIAWREDSANKFVVVPYMEDELTAVVSDLEELWLDLGGLEDEVPAALPSSETCDVVGHLGVQVAEWK